MTLLSDARHDISHFIEGALVFTIALAWNTAISQTFKESKVLHTYGLYGYAVLITIVGVLAKRFMSEKRK